jgi:hypothetical protein
MQRLENGGFPLNIGSLVSHEAGDNEREPIHPIDGTMVPNPVAPGVGALTTSLARSLL